MSMAHERRLNELDALTKDQDATIEKLKEFVEKLANTVDKLQDTVKSLKPKRGRPKSAATK
jgi:uncharacterized coiled-coil protein SlyX